VTATEQAQVSRPAVRTMLPFAARTLRLAWSASPRLLLGIALVTTAVATAPVLAAFLGKLIIDGVITAIETGLAADRTMVLVWVAAETAVLSGLFASRRLLAFLKRLLHAEIGFRVSCLIHAKTTALDLETIERPDIQQLVVMARQNAAQRPYSLVNRSFDAFQYIVTVVSLSALLWTFSPLILLVIVAAGLPLFLGELRFSSHKFRFYLGRTPEMRARSYLETLMAGDIEATERIHSQANDALSHRYRDLFTRLFHEDRRMQSRQTAISLGLIGASTVIFVGGQIWVAWATLVGTITLGQMTMFAALLKQGQNTVTAFLTTMSGSYEDLLYMSKLFELLDVDEGRSRGRATYGPEPGDGYRLKGVSFSYPNGTRPALSAIDLHIPAGRRLGIVGANGSGKTTLVKLLTGLYLPSDGTITLDGLPLQDWAPEALYARTAVMFQPYQRYNFTVAENIAMGEGLRVDDPDRLTEAARRGFADGLVADLPDGLGTRLSRQFLEGRELSGGQWQRLALSRAMLRVSADTLILDEPTAALDPETEADLIAGLDGSRRTTILISPRLANLVAAEEVVVLDRGAVAEQGTHRELLARTGIYRSMFDRQAAFYRSNEA